MVQLSESKRSMEPPPNNGFEKIDDMPAQHIRLFAPWIFDDLLKHSEKYTDVLDEDQFTLLSEIYVIPDEKKKEIELINASPKIFYDDTSAQKLLKRHIEVCKTNSFVKDHAFFTPPVCTYEAFKIYWEKFLHHHRLECMIDRLGIHLPLSHLLDYFYACTEITYRDFSTKLMATTNSETKPFVMWKNRCELIVSLITCQPKKRKPEYWYFEFLKACNGHPESRAIAMCVEGDDYPLLLEDYELELQKQFQPKAQTTVEFADELAPTEPRPQESFGRRPPQITGDYAANYELRKYQLELGVKAKQGLSTCICAPTGSGKTHVALDIIVSHLRRKRVSNKVGRVAMFVPTIPLVNQQFEHLTRNTLPEFYVEKLSGAEKVMANGDIREADIILSADIIVMTPQIFINMLQSPLRSQRMYLADFTLFVFDECHHCTALHPYMILMNHVRKANVNLQVVGLTASVGDGSSSKEYVSAQEAMNHMLSLCARLNASTISSVREKANEEEMYYYISQPQDEIFTLRPPMIDHFAHLIAIMSDSVQEELKKELIAASEDLPNLESKHFDLPIEGSDYKNGSCKVTPQYNGRLALIKHNVELKYCGSNDRRYFLLKCVELLEVFHFTLRFNELQPTYLAYEYLEEKLNEIKTRLRRTAGLNEGPNNFEQKLDRIYKDVFSQMPAIEHAVSTPTRKPILDKLVQCIEEQYTKDSTSRIIIFIESRKGCVKLAEFLENNPKIHRAFGEDSVGYIVSSNQSGSKHGQSYAHQQSTLRRFREGTINILVATSVAEEGLDVAACNLVIKYNNVGSEKTLIQRRGRARAKNSRSILLALSDSIEQQEFRNIIRAHRMKLCLSALQELSEDELKTKIDEKKRIIMAELAKEEARMEDLRRKYENNVCRLECINCGIAICHSNELAHLMESQYICCNPGVWKDTKINQRFSKGHTTSVTSLCGEWVCHCGKKRGEVIKYCGAFLPTLAADAFRMSQKRDGRYEIIEEKKPTWKVITTTYFAVGPITISQIKDMVTSLYDYKPELYNDVLANEKKGIIEATKPYEIPLKDKLRIIE